MKCPKCGYLGFETTDRCRHCGYDFSLSVSVEPASELPLRSPNEPEAALADLALDRVIGGPDAPLTDPPAAVATPSQVTLNRELPPGNDPPALPLFSRSRRDPDDAPLIAPPPPARPPLAVRRATPEVPRRRTPRTIRRDADGPELQLDPVIASAPDDALPTVTSSPTADDAPPKVRRLSAAVLDLLLLGGINAAVLYLTLAIAGLSMRDMAILPPIPMGAFLLLLNGGYLVAFTAANGQTIGKMLFGVRVIGDDEGRVAIADAVVRAAGVMLTIVTLGLAYVPVLVSRDGRALHDRLAGTRVIKHA